MKPSSPSSTANVLAAATMAGLSLTAGPTDAATFSSSATPPTVDGADVANLGAQSGTDKWFFQSGNEVDPADWAKGQTFTTGAATLLLNALTYKIASGNKKTAPTTYTIRIGMPSGTTFNQVFSETCSQTADTAAGDYVTWTFGAPVLLLPDTTYAIDVAMVSGTTWQTGIPYLSFTADNFAGGQFYNSGPAGGSGGGPTISLNAARDRVFHLDLAVAPAFAHWDLNGGVAGVGSAAPAGTWNTANTNWNPAADGIGSTVSWLAGFTAVFAAGSDATGPYTVTVDGTQDIGGLTFEEGTVTLTPGTAGGLRLVGDANMVVAPGLTATVATPNSEDAAPRTLTKGGDGTLVLSGANLYSGATIIQAGTLRLGAGNVLPDASAVTLSGQAAGVIPTLDLNGNSDTLGSLSLGGAFPGSGAAVTTGAGTLTLGGDVTYNHFGTNLLGATISGKLELGASRTFTVKNSATVANDLTVSADISGTGFELIKEGTGTLVLAGNNAAATGGMTLNGGAVQFETPASLNGTARDVTVNTGATVVFGSSFGAGNIPAALSNRIVAYSEGTIGADYQDATDFNFKTPDLSAASLGAVGSVSYTGTLTPQGTTYRLGGGGGTLTLTKSNALTGGGNELVVIGPGTVVLADANDYGGGTTVSAGTLQIGNGGTKGSLNPSSAVITDATLAFNRSDTVTQGTDFASVISGLGGVTQAGSGTLVLNGANDYTGPTTVVAGTLRLAESGTIASSSSLVLNTGTLQLLSNDSATFNTPAVQVAPGATATIEVNNNGSGTGNTLTLSGGIVSSNSTAGIATVNVTGGNDYVLDVATAAVNATGGSPKLGFNPTTASIRIGTLSSSAPFGQRCEIHLGGTNAGNAVNTISPSTLAPINMYKEGPGKWTVGDYCTPAAPQGTVTITDGTLTVTGTLCPQAGTLLNGGQLNYDNPGAVRGSLSINGGNLDNTSGAAIATSTYNPAQTWSSDFTFRGSQGTNSDLNLGTGAVGLGATRQVTVANPAATLTIGGVISGAGSGLTKAGEGTLALTAASTYDGPTTISAGTLAVTGSLGATAVSVNAGTLAGNGNIGGDVTIAAGARHALAVAATPAAQITRAITGTLALASGNILDLTAATTPAGGVYLLATATVDITGTPTIIHSNGISGTVSVDTASTPKKLLLTVTAAGFDSWQTKNGATGQTLAQDHDGDGVSNGIEYFLVGPNGNSTGFTPLPGVTNTGGTPSVTWTKAADYTGVYGTDFRVETSATLTGTWTPETLAPSGTVTITGNEVRLTFPTPLGTKNFARLKVTGP